MSSALEVHRNQLWSGGSYIWIWWLYTYVSSNILLHLLTSRTKSSRALWSRHTLLKQNDSSARQVNDLMKFASHHEISAGNQPCPLKQTYHWTMKHNITTRHTLHINCIILLHLTNSCRPYLTRISLYIWKLTALYFLNVMYPIYVKEITCPIRNIFIVGNISRNFDAVISLFSTTRSEKRWSVSTNYTKLSLCAAE